MRFDAQLQREGALHRLVVSVVNLHGEFDRLTSFDRTGLETNLLYRLLDEREKLTGTGFEVQGKRSSNHAAIKHVVTDRLRTEPVELAAHPRHFAAGADDDVVGLAG